MDNLGEQLRQLPDGSGPERVSFVDRARAEHALFWDKWHPFRCTEEGDENGNAFWHVVDLIDRDTDADGTRGLFAQFCQLKPGTLVVDLAAGPRPNMLEVLLHHSPDLCGYVAMEPPESSAKVHQNFHLNGHGKLLEYVPWDFWDVFPTASIRQIAQKRRASATATITYWGATYLPAQEIRTWVKAALTVSDAIYINMMTSGKFQPEVLRKRYTPLLFKLVASGKIKLSEAVRALAAIKKMVRFGTEFGELMPLWTAPELQAMLSGLCRIGRVREDTLWGQTTFIELLPK
jgi:hypothetical protein